VEILIASHISTTSNNNNDNVVVKQLKEELAGLLEEDAKTDKLRSLPLYSCRITGWKFVCSKCYDKVYTLLQMHSPLKEKQTHLLSLIISKVFG
jgi:hypothetical protein